METPIVCSGKMPHKTNKPTEECFALNILTWIWNPMPKMNAIRKLVSSAIIPESNVFVVFAGKNDDNYTLKTAEYWNGSKWKNDACRNLRQLRCGHREPLGPCILWCVRVGRGWLHQWRIYLRSC
jgi:hypothetical protein